MRRFCRDLALRCVLPALLLGTTAQAQGPPAGSHPTPELLQSRIAEIEILHEIDDATATRLVQLYRKALANLEQARGNRQSLEEYRDAGVSSTHEAERTRATLKRKRSEDATFAPQVPAGASAEVLDQLLQEALAHRAAAEADLRAIEARLEVETLRPEQVRDRIGTVRATIGEMTGSKRPRTDTGEGPLLAEASQWVYETGLEALQSEIVLLEQELLSHPARIDLLRALRDEAAHTAAIAGEPVGALLAAIDEHRRAEADSAEAEARTVLDRDPRPDSRVRDLAKANLILVKRMRQQAATLEILAQEEERVRPQSERLAEAVRGTLRKLQLAGSEAPTGLAIRVQRQQLPTIREYTRRRRDVHRAITAASLSRLDSEEERRQLEDLDAYLGSFEEDGDDDLSQEARQDLEALSRTRRTLVGRILASDRALQRRLYDVDDVLRRLEEQTAAYDEFLAERLLWTRSQRAVDLDAIRELPGELAAYFSPGKWRAAGSAAARGLVRAPALLLAVLGALALAARRRSIRRALALSAAGAGPVETGRISSTLVALARLLLLAIPAPLALWAVGMAMVSASGGSSFSIGVGGGLTRASHLLLVLLSARLLCEPGGVAEHHFGVHRATLVRLQRHLGWPIGLAVPLHFLMVSVSLMRPATAGGTLGLLAFVGFTVALFGLALVVIHPEPGGARGRGRVVLGALALATLVAVVVLALIGFTHTAVELIRRAFASAEFIAALWLARAVTLRWLLMTRRSLSDDAVASPRGERSPPDVEEGLEHAGSGRTGNDIGAAEVDLAARDADSRGLLDAAMVLLGMFGLAWIWGEVVPALGVLGRFGLWSTAVMVDGSPHQASVTIADVLAAVVIGIAGGITARNLPSLLDIVLLKQGRVSAGVRYAIQTLTRYSTVAATVLMVLGALGASWSQMGWAAAALGLGIGFGVQEIVANFICGLILLFERPVRVGDVITLGDASGLVTRIRIRATTIRDWDQKELIVPNKELITGRLLNWTLSDSVVRLLLQVGVAYGSDVDRALGLILEAARESESVLEEPPPSVNFEQFGDSSLQLTLRAYVGSFPDRLPTLTALHGAIDRKFREAGIVIAFPQRDVHFHPKSEAGVGEAGERRKSDAEDPRERGS